MNNIFHPLLVCEVGLFCKEKCIAKNPCDTLDLQKNGIDYHNSCMGSGKETGYIYLDTEDKLETFKRIKDIAENYIKNMKEQFEKDRYCAPCSGCPDGHPSFWKTVVESPQWKTWEKEQSNICNKVFAIHRNDKLSDDEKNIERQKLPIAYDMSEVVECGIISPRHFQDFLEFCKINDIRN